MKLKCLYILIFFRTLFIQAQEPYFINYTSADGLPSMQTYQVVKDQEGFIWFTSDAGIGKFDMGKIKTLNRAGGLPDNTVFLLSPYQKDKFIGSCYNRNLFQVNIKSMVVEKAFEKLTTQFGEANDVLFQNFVDKDIACVSSLNVCYKYDLKRDMVQKMPIPGDVAFQLNVIKNEVLICSKSDLVGKVVSHKGSDSPLLIELIKDGQKKTYNIPVRSIKKSVNNFRAICLSGNRIAFAFHNMLYILLPNGSFVQYDFESEILCSYEDAAKNMWVGTRNNGVFFLTSQNADGYLENYLTEKSISGICEDNEGGMWLSTLHHGIFYAPSVRFKQLKHPLLFQQNILKIDSLHNRLFALTQGSQLFSISESSFNRLEVTNFKEMPDYNMNSFMCYGKGVFVNGRDGSILFDDNLKTIKLLPELVNTLRAMVVGKNNTIWLTYFFGLSTFKPDSSNYISENRIPITAYGLAINKKNEVLVGAINGLHILKNNRLHPLYYRFPILKNRIDYVFVDSKNRYWLAINGFGLAILNDKTIYVLRENENSLHGKIKRIIEINDNYWVATNSGLYRIMSNRNKINTYSIACFAPPDGLPDNEINDILLYKDFLVAATGKGLCYSNIKNISKVYPCARIKLSVNENEHITRKDEWIELEYDFNKLFIEISQPAYRDFKKIKYAYKFENDSAYVLHNSSVIVLENLKPGNYTLLVKNANQGEGSPVSILKFKVKKPFWQKGLFIVLLLTLLAIAMYLYIAYRTNRIKKISAEKIRVERLINEYRMTSLQAQMNPHFMFNAFSSIQKYILTQQTEQAYDYLTKFSKLIRIVLDSSRSSYISLKDEVTLLTLYMEVEQLRIENKFSFNIEIDKKLHIDSVSLPTMLIQPHIENAIWHGISHLKNTLGFIHIHVSETEDSILVKVKDNGVGRYTSAKLNANLKKQHNSLSTQINIERLKLFDSAMYITDLYDEQNNPMGTLIEITIKKNDD